MIVNTMLSECAWPSGGDVTPPHIRASHRADFSTIVVSACVQGCTSISNILQRASSESGALAEFRAAVALAADALAVRHDSC